MLDLTGRENSSVIAQVEDLILAAPKLCKCCGTSHLEVAKGVVCKLGYVWFNCACSSTLIVKYEPKKEGV